jgi:aminoglycoside phosphotransferase (APT) family kinase protein
VKVVELLAARGYRVDSVRPLGSGLDNVTYEVNGELVVRLARSPDPVAVDREVRLLALLAEVSPLPVPAPVLAVPELGCLAYPKLPGVPLLELGRGAGHEAALAEFLAALHAVPPAHVEDVVAVDDAPPGEWLDDAAAAAELVPAAHRTPVERFLAAPPPRPAGTLVFSHNDLGAEHVLVDGDTVTGVIDWSDAAITDPAHDLGLLLRDLGTAPLDAYRASAELRERALFHARCGLLADLAYGARTGRAAYTRNSLAALERLF